VINDPFLCATDVVEPRHLGASTAACLDGHVILISCALPNNCPGKLCTVDDNGPKMIHKFLEYCPNGKQ